MERSKMYVENLVTKIEGVGHFIFENSNGLSPWKKWNQNILMEKHFAQILEAGSYSVTECR